MADHADRGENEREAEGEQGGLREAHRAKRSRLRKPMLERRGNRRKLGTRCHDQGGEQLEKKESQLPPALRGQEPPFGEPGEYGEVYGQQEGGCVENCATDFRRPGGAGREVEERSVGQGEDEECQDQAASIKAPREQDSPAENDVEIDGEERGERAPEGCRVRERRGGEEKDAARQKTRDGRFHLLSF